MLREKTWILTGKTQGISQEQRGGRYPACEAGSVWTDAERDHRYSLAFNLATSSSPKPASRI